MSHNTANEVLLKMHSKTNVQFAVELFVYHQSKRKFVSRDIRGASSAGPVQLLSCHSTGVTRSIYSEHLFYVRLPTPGNRCMPMHDRVQMNCTPSTCADDWHVQQKRACHVFLLAVVQCLLPILTKMNHYVTNL